MKRKFLAVVITAAMVAGAPGLVLAAPAAEDTSEIQTVQQTEDIQESDTEGLVETEEVPETPEADRQEETPAMQEAGEISGTQEVQSPDAERNTAVETAGVSASADVIDTEQELADAIAQGGEINLTGQRIELTSPLYVNNDVVIKGGTLVGTDSVTGNLVTLMGNKVTLEGVMIRTSAGNKSALHVYGTDLTVNDLTIDHSSAAGGAPVIINNGAEAVFTGDVKLTLGSSSWYGINVDNAKADFSGAALNVTPVTDTQSVICSEGDDASVTGAGFTVVVTEKDGGANHRQTAYVADSNLAQFVKAKTEAGADISLIELNKDVTLTAPLYLREATTMRSSASGNYTINGSGAIGADNVVTIMADGVVLEGLGIKTASANKSALHVYRVSATLKDITLDNRETAGGAGMIVNGGTVTVEGKLNLLLGENSWGGINVDTKNGAAGVTFADGSAVNMSGSDQNVIYIDKDNDTDLVTITGAEEAGLAQDADGNYIIEGQEEDTDPSPEQPGDGEDEQKPEGGSADGSQNDDDTPAKGDELSDGGSSVSGQADDKKNAEKNMKKAPQTGDNSTGLYIALAALLGSGTAAGSVLKKRRELMK